MKEGWKCPGCNKVYAPHSPMCFFCGGYASGTATTAMVLEEKLEVKNEVKIFVAKRQTKNRAIKDVVIIAENEKKAMDILNYHFKGIPETERTFWIASEYVRLIPGIIYQEEIHDK